MLLYIGEAVEGEPTDWGIPTAGNASQ